MAQQVVIAGAMFEDVPSISVPDVNNVYHPFLDTTIASNAAAASDIAQGKLAYVNGSLVTGTNQGGGGGGTLKVGAIRPDAVLEQSWTYDKLIHADEGVTIPSYSTNAQTVKSETNLVTNKVLDCTQYDWFVTVRGLANPIYSSSAKAKGRFEYFVSGYSYEIYCLPKNAIQISGTTSSRYVLTGQARSQFQAFAYWNSATELYAQSGIYGTYLNANSPTATFDATNGTATITIKSQSLCMRGSTSYYTSTYWGYTTDVRYQYIVQLWKAPRTCDINGWENTSQAVHAAACAQSASGTLT